MSAMNIHLSTTEALAGVRAALNYLAPGPQRPRSYAYEPPAGVPRSTIINEPHTVEIRNARRLLSAPRLDAEGFALVHHPSAVTNFYDDAEVERVYYAEARNLLQEVTGAARVLVFDH